MVHPRCKLAYGLVYERLFSPIRGQSIELCAGGDVCINHQQMELFLAVFVMHG